jgi:hypothetical protein
MVAAMAENTRTRARGKLAPWVLVNLVILAAIDLLETVVYLLAYSVHEHAASYEAPEAATDDVSGALVVAFLIVYPYLLIGTAIYLTVLWRRASTRRLPVTRRRALLLSPLVALPLALLLGILPSGTAPLWLAAGTITYGLFVRLP